MRGGGFSFASFLLLSDKVQGRSERKKKEILKGLKIPTEAYLHRLRAFGGGSSIKRKFIVCQF